MGTREVCVGDIVLIKYEQQLNKDRYRLGKVQQVLLDEHQRVRTVVGVTRDRRKAIRERREVCRAGLVEMTLPVQRLVVILPSGESWEQGAPVETLDA